MRGLVCALGVCLFIVIIYQIYALKTHRMEVIAQIVTDS